MFRKWYLEGFGIGTWKVSEVVRWLLPSRCSPKERPSRGANKVH
jgi:hypothetical protein